MNLRAEGVNALSRDARKGGMAFGAHERGALRPLRALRFARGFPPKQSFFGACHGRGVGRARAERIPTEEAHRRMPP